MFCHKCFLDFVDLRTKRRAFDMVMAVRRLQEEKMILVMEMKHHWRSLSTRSDSLKELSCLVSRATMQSMYSKFYITRMYISVTGWKVCRASSEKSSTLLLELLEAAEFSSVARSLGSGCGVHSGTGQLYCDSRVNASSPPGAAQLQLRYAASRCCFQEPLWITELRQCRNKTPHLQMSWYICELL